MTRNSYVPSASPTAARSRAGWRRWESGVPLLLAAALALTAGCKSSDDDKKPDDDPFAGLASCKGIAITADGTLDVDLKTLRISGRVTLNGGALPDVAGRRLGTSRNTAWDMTARTESWNSRVKTQGYSQVEDEATVQVST